MRFVLGYLLFSGVCLAIFGALTWRELVPQKPKLRLVK